MTAERIYVKPGLKPGVKPEEATPADLLMVRDEYSLKAIPAEGAWVKLTRFVRRRLTDKDLVRADAPVEEPPAAQPEEVAPEQPAEASVSDETAPVEETEAEGTSTRRRRRAPGSED